MLFVYRDRQDKINHNIKQSNGIIIIYGNRNVLLLL